MNERTMPSGIEMIAHKNVIPKENATPLNRPFSLGSNSFAKLKAPILEKKIPL